MMKNLCPRFFFKMINLSFFVLVIIARLKAEECCKKYFKVVSSEGPSLTPEEIISSHNVEHPVKVNCNFLCFNAGSKCAGFNFRAKANAVNCQLTNTAKNTNYTKGGEWTLYQDINVASIDNEKKKPSEVQPISIATTPTFYPLIQPTSIATTPTLSLLVQPTSILTTPTFSPLVQPTAVSTTPTTFNQLDQTTSISTIATLGISCSSLYKSGERKNSVYTINPDGLGSFQVRCDMQTDGGGWTVFQKRQDASVHFYRGWQDYKTGFGDLDGNFWLGLDQIHRLTKSGQNVLRVDLMDWTNDTAYAKYGSFSVASESDDYKLNVDGFSGNAGDSLANHNGMKFSTYDKDNDQASHANCALSWQSAWWFNSCHYSDLNGIYLNAGEMSWSGLNWFHWKNDNRSMEKAEMKMRPVGY